MHPPKWADRFLEWYCNPDLLEEIQGDAHELYTERVSHEGKTSADWKYVFDVIRFFRWSNIKRTNNEHRPGYFRILWNLNIKIALRNAFRNKLVFSVRMLGLSICLAFALIVSAFIIQEFNFDAYHIDHERIVRVGSRVEIQGAVTNYAVSPVALGDALAEEIPEVESACWFMYNGKPPFLIEDKSFNNEVAFVASDNFLNVFTFEFIQGTPDALDMPNKIVLTETTAVKFFGIKDPIGQTVDLEWTQLEVAAVIKDVPVNSHLKFDVLISWNTFDFNEGWDNLNTYTYIKLRNDLDVEAVRSQISTVFRDHREEIEGGQEHRSGDDIKIEPIVQPITSIHTGENMDEDIAVKRSEVNLYILIAVVFLFFITGLINFLNLSLAELTTNLRKIGILRVFGGATANHGKIIVTDTFFSICFVIPITVFLIYAGRLLSESYFSIFIDSGVFISHTFMIVAGVFMLLFLFSSKLNSFLLSRSNDIINALKGKLSGNQNGFQVRGVLVAAQLSFSIVMIALIVIIVDQFRYINAADKGFEDKNTIVVKMRSGDFAAAGVFEESLKKLSGIKKVDGSSLYPDNVETKEFFEIDTESGAKKMLIAYMNCGYEYLDALKIELASGRNFDVNHGADSRGAYIINEAAVREFNWKEPLGKKIRGPLGTDRDEGDVIGVVKDFHFASLHSKIEPLIIFLVNEDWGIRYVYIKVNPIHPHDLISRIEREYKKSFHDLPFDWEYLDSKYAGLYKEDYEIRNVFQVGLIISVFVSCLGIFSLSALLVIMREKEMGIRKVVGANSYQLFLLHLKSFVRFMTIAIFIAWPTIYYLSGYWLDNFAYHIDINLWYFIFPGLITLVIILVTCSFHGLKSAHVNPIDILKHE